MPNQMWIPWFESQTYTVLNCSLSTSYRTVLGPWHGTENQTTARPRVERDVPSHPPLKTTATIRTLNSPSNVECLKFGFQILEPCPKKPGKENKTTATFVARETTVSTVTHVTKKRLFRFRLFCLPDLPSRNPGRTQMHRRVRTHRRGERRSRGGAYANAYNSGTKEVSQVRPKLSGPFEPVKTVTVPGPSGVSTS